MTTSYELSTISMQLNLTVPFPMAYVIVAKRCMLKLLFLLCGFIVTTHVTPELLGNTYHLLGEALIHPWNAPNHSI